MANSVDPDQTAQAVWSGSALFAYAILLETLVYEILGYLREVWSNKPLEGYYFGATDIDIKFFWHLC